jgi:hypothetical protein
MAAGYYLLYEDADGNAVKVSAANPLPSVNIVNGTTADRELIVTTYFCKTAFAGASVGDTITNTQIIDVSGSPSVTLETVWRNQSTAADLGAAPPVGSLELVGSQALTLAQLLSAQLATAAKQDLQTTALDGINTTATAINAKLPATLGSQAAAGSLGVTWSAENAAAVAGLAAKIDTLNANVLALLAALGTTNTKLDITNAPAGYKAAPDGTLLEAYRRLLDGTLQTSVLTAITDGTGTRYIPGLYE